MLQENTKIIFLNGASNSGKTTIAKELQNIMEEPYLHIGIEAFMDMMPQQYIGESERAKLGFYMKRQKDGSGRVLGKIEAGSYGKRVITGMGYACLALAQKGLNIIVDEVCYGQGQLQFYQYLYRDYRTLFVGVVCPLDILMQREHKADIGISTAKNESKIVHQDIDYDFMVDTSLMTALECAEDIKAAASSQFKQKVSSF